MSSLAQERRDLLRLRHRHRVDHPRARQLVQTVGEPGEPMRVRGAVAGPPDAGSPCRVTREAPVQSRAADRAELLADVVDHSSVRGRGRREHWHALREIGEQRADASVVGAKVVAPVRDAVRLVDDEEPGFGGEGREHGVAETRVVQPLWADQQHVDRAGRNLCVHLRPLLGVGRVDRSRADARPLGRRDLVAHESQQRRDDHGRAGAARAQQGRRDEVDGRLPPAGPLDDEHPPAVDDQRLDRPPLIVAQRGAFARQPPEHRLRPFAKQHSRAHTGSLTTPGDIS